MVNIHFIAQDVELPDFDQETVSNWIESVARSFDKSVGSLTYIFCNDARILEVNNQFLKHDYYTDIITFDYSRPRRISGDMFISLDTVKSNADLFGREYPNELMRVIIHGVLHLCGVNDKGEGEREVMEKFEDNALTLLSKF
jgi:metalloprotein, YbeY family